MQLRAFKIGFIREHQFCARKWRFDFAVPDKRVAFEIEGGTWISGRHNTGAGSQKDMEKYNEAAILGWKVLRFTTDMVKSGYAIQAAQRLLAT